MIREGVESILNPFDEFALEYALKIKVLPDFHLLVISSVIQAHKYLVIE